ncbi:chromosome segregation protein Csm1/Pcs1-domain-containing protein [Staphylotrichum tortipilum]|uniref:Chromosome segregation protein Csm1/Pcs1-domain-containing protein n=1 Tax=Staphylotrichum tortipilum TaxID=2831512 RepID=A0AAN6MJZ8_9PEZI|nr:chromosome segregation protein Csm1/Pcs1-domain-containing protein [Staphylotrichum longicolle]
MSKTKVRSHLLQLVDSDSDDGIGGSSLHTARTSTASKPRSATMPPKKGKPGRLPANRVTKPVPTKASATARQRATDRVAAAVDELAGGGGGAATKKDEPAKATGRGRGRKPAVPAEDEEEDDDDTAMTDAPETVVETPPPAAKPKGGRGRPRKVVVEPEPEPEPEPQPAPARRSRKPAAKKTAVVEDVSEIPETQQPDAPESDADDDQDDLADLPVVRSPERTRAGRGNAPAPSSISKRPQPSSLSPDKGDPALRRRLGEMTQKYESLEHKYRDLKEVAVREAERNFDKLKKQSEEKSKAADDLISTLKAELVTQKEASKETLRLQKQLEATELKATTLQSRLTELTTALTDSKSEIKSLQLKLSAARSAEAAAVGTAQHHHHQKVPGSAIKSGGPSTTAGSRLAAAAASEAHLTAQMKEDLYGDLTGLIVRGVKRGAGTAEDVFDCIQTGRNGTLHFKLAIEAGEDGGENQCHYTPHLDENRDRALIAVLPGYLVDEISFPQAQAGKFYARVLKALNEVEG